MSVPEPTLPALRMKANNHCFRGRVGFSEALGGRHSALAYSGIRTFTAKVGNFQDMQKNKLSKYFLPHRFLKRVTNKVYIMEGTSYHGVPITL